MVIAVRNAGLPLLSVAPVAGCMCSAARNSIRTCCQAECSCRSECADEVCQVEWRLLVHPHADSRLPCNYLDPRTIPPGRVTD